jgi:hypothetical protein
MGIFAQLTLNDGDNNVLSRNRSCAYDGGRSTSDSDGDVINRYPKERSTSSATSAMRRASVGSYPRICRGYVSEDCALQVALSFDSEHSAFVVDRLSIDR